MNDFVLSYGWLVGFWFVYFVGLEMYVVFGWVFGLCLGYIWNVVGGC